MKLKFISKDGKPPELCSVTYYDKPIVSITKAEIGETMFSILEGCLHSRNHLVIDTHLYTLLVSNVKRLEWDLKHARDFLCELNTEL